MAKKKQARKKTNPAMRVYGAIKDKPFVVVLRHGKFGNLDTKGFSSKAAAETWAGKNEKRYWGYPLFVEGRIHVPKGKRKNPAKKKATAKKSRGRKLVGAAKSAFLKLMAAGRKNAGKRKAAAGKKRAKPVKRNPAAKGATKKVKARKTSVRRPRKQVRRRRNDGQAADAFYEKTHGHKPEKDTFVTERLHEHSVLVGLGKLHELVIRNRAGEDIVVDGFGGAVAASNESGTQLFIKGGNQSVDLKPFNMAAPHEIQVLGSLVEFTYHARKDHLTPETGGTGLYVHKFKAPYPTVTYDVRNKLLTIAGGAYVLKDVGVVR